MIKELDCVVLTTDLPEHGLCAGDVGTVVLAHGNEAYEVEFAKGGGAETIAVLTLRIDMVRAIAENEILHARNVEAA